MHGIGQEASCKQWKGDIANQYIGKSFLEPEFHANIEQDQHGNVNDDWRAPIWTREGGYLWDVDAQVYEMVI